MLQLRCDHPTISLVCAQVESRLPKNADIPDLVLDVEVQPSFALNEDAVAHNAQDQPAFYIRSKGRIFINEEKFATEPAFEQISIIAHELAHAVRHHTGKEHPFRTMDEVETDGLACSWGFHEEVIASRRQTYGEEYGQCLSTWPDGDAFRTASERWVNRKLAGLL